MLEIPIPCVVKDQRILGDFCEYTLVTLTSTTIFDIVAMYYLCIHAKHSYNTYLCYLQKIYDCESYHQNHLRETLLVHIILLLYILYIGLCLYYC